MADPKGSTDPETEALIRQLHREVNGLTRARRGGALTVPDAKRLKKDHQPSGRQHQSTPSTSRDQATASAHSEDARQRPHKGRAGATDEDDSRRVRPLEGQPSGKELQERARIDKELLRAARMASEDAKRRMRLRESGASKRMKCYVTGLPYCIPLDPTAAESRQALAAKLAPVLASEGRSCPTPHNLHALFLTSQGQVIDCRPQKAKWPATIDATTRVFVHDVSSR